MTCVDIIVDLNGLRLINPPCPGVSTNNKNKMFTKHKTTCVPLITYRISGVFHKSADVTGHSLKVQLCRRGFFLCAEGPNLFFSTFYKKIKHVQCLTFTFVEVKQQFRVLLFVKFEIKTNTLI